MESNDQFSQELPSELSQIAESEPENSTNQELDELELDALAGGLGFMFQDWHNIPRFSPINYEAFAGKKVG
ncbi:hypothetical protein QUB75_02290 [Microcoleus sp. K1-B6]|uniref:hypothetical protein n=1 Tax=unclassified Microcoleus TaxID=2642155 RepID=UPI002FD31A34